MAVRRLVVLLAAVVVLLVTAGLTAGGAAANPPSAAPGYLADDFHALTLASNEFMSGAKVVGKRYPVQGLFPKATPESSAPIWAFKCSASAETVTFGRSIWLPGPPNYGGKFTFGSVLGQREFRALSTIDLIVNGDVIVHQALPAGTGYFTVPVSGAALKAFRFEANTIQVRVHKRATRGQCNTGKPASQVGVLFSLAGQFETDLALNPPLPDQFVKLAPNQTFTQGVYINFHNDGPAWEPNGTFQLHVDGAPAFALGSGVLAPPSAPLTNCQQSDNGLSHSVSCGLSDFAPGTSSKLGTVFQVKAPASDYSDFSVAWSWYIGAGAIPDLDASNNQRYVTFVFCGSKSTNPGCQTAS
jgi:hypothetical protein